MIQLTTPTHEFRLPFGTENVKEVRVLYAQNDTVLLKKFTADCSMDGSVVSVTLTQQETEQFTAGVNVDIQIRVVTTDGKVMASRKFTVECFDNLDSEVI